MSFIFVRAGNVPVRNIASQVLSMNSKRIEVWAGVLWAVLLMALACPVQAAVSVDGTTNQVWLGKSLDIVLDPDGRINVQAMAEGRYDDKMFRVDRDIPTFGYGNHRIYWARFQLHNPTADAIQLLLVARYAPLDRLTLYTPLGESSFDEMTLGDQIAFHKRPIPYRYPIYPITLKPGTSTYFLKLQTSSSAQFPLTLATKDQFIQHDTTETLFLGVIFGSMLIMLFYNLFVYFKFRSKAYLLYVVYILCYLTFSFNYQGLLQQFLLPEVEESAAFNSFLMCNIDFIFLMAVTFSNEFLELKARSPRIYAFNRGLQLLALGNVLNTLFFNAYATQITLMSSFIMSLYLIACGLYMSMRFRPARYYTLAWTSVLIGNAILILAGSGSIPLNLFTSWSQFVGAALEMLLLSLALGDRMALIQEERSAIQKKLGIVLQNRVMLVSELAHKTNNPLNYISTSSAILRQNQSKHQKLLQNLLRDLSTEEQNLLEEQRAQRMAQIADDCHDNLSTIDQAIQKAALCIAEIRSLTGVDGFHKERLTLTMLLEASRHRIQDGLGEGSLKGLVIAPEAQMETALFTNRFAFSLSLEWIFRFWHRHPMKNGELRLTTAMEEDGASELVIMIPDAANRIGRDFASNLMPQLSDLLLPYGCELITRERDGHTRVVFRFLKTTSLAGPAAVVHDSKWKAA
jgi:signal transduction histidine kinase